MVLESILSPESAERNPLKIALLSVIFVSVGIFSSIFIGYPNGFLLVALVAVPSVPLILNLFNYEEEGIEEGSVWGSRIAARHLPIVVVLIAYFGGLLIGFGFWYIILPDETGNSLFAVQINELKNIGGSFGSVGGYAVKMDSVSAFELIFMHNLEVLAFILLFSILYGSGAVFVLIWNASVVSVFIVNMGKQFVLHEAPQFSLISGLSYGILGLIPHGTFELLAYLVGALAGGILSSAIVRKAYLRGEFATVMRDIAKLAAWAIIFLAIGAVIESQAFA
ncbi:stage II sporulation protein M [Candidatus Micrarchaeota archaeon]|nr:stage II sporulation protein M [Candidatus Micrarchaeota archaeon]